MSYYPNREHVFLICAVLAIIVSGVQIALERGVLDYYQKHMESYWEPWPPRVLTRYTKASKHLSMMPASLTSIPTDLIFASAAVGIFASAITIFRFLAIINAHTGERDRVAQVARGPYADERSGHLQTWEISACSISSLSVAFSFGVLVATFVEEYTGSEFHYTDFKSSAQHFTRESWMCAMAHQYGANYYRTVCRKAQAGRWLLLPLFMLLSVMLACIVLNIRTPKRRSSEDEKGTVQTAPRRFSEASDDSMTGLPVSYPRHVMNYIRNG